MKFETDVTFRNLSSTDWIDQDIRHRARQLSVFCPDITSCRVLLEIPHRHQQEGRRFHVRIDLSVRGGDITISHAPNLHAAQQDLGEPAWTKHAEIEASRKDIQLVIRKAFEIARRRLQGYAQRRRREVKTHASRTSGRATRPVTEVRRGA